MRELRYADNSQSVSQQTGSSGWLRRKTGRVCRMRNFAASQTKNRLPHLGEFAGAFRKIVIYIDCECPVPVPYNFKKPVGLMGGGLEDW